MIELTRSAADGTYAFWAADKANTITLIASKDGWASQSSPARLKNGATVTVNFALRPLAC
jgi:hypothetical protein